MGQLVRHGHRCPCCGYFGLGVPPYERLLDPSQARRLQPPYGLHFGYPSHEVCGCCGYEYGYDDEPGAGAGLSFEDYLEDGIAGRCHWLIPGQKPDGWDLDEQLAQAGLERPRES
jgi:hypothetical protein